MEDLGVPMNSSSALIVTFNPDSNVYIMKNAPTGVFQKKIQA